MRRQNVLYSVKHGDIEYTIELGTYSDGSQFYKIIRYGNTRMMLKSARSYNRVHEQLDQLMIDLKTNPHAWSTM